MELKNNEYLSILSEGRGYHSILQGSEIAKVSLDAVHRKLAFEHKVSKNDQEIRLVHTADQIMASFGRATEHLQSLDIREEIKAKQPAVFSSTR